MRRMFQRMLGREVNEKAQLQATQKQEEACAKSQEFRHDLLELKRICMTMVIDIHMAFATKPNPGLNAKLGKMLIDLSYIKIADENVASPLEDICSNLDIILRAMKDQPFSLPNVDSYFTAYEPIKLKEDDDLGGRMKHPYYYSQEELGAAREKDFLAPIDINKKCSQDRYLLLKGIAKHHLDNDAKLHEWVSAASALEVSAYAQNESSSCNLSPLTESGEAAASASDVCMSSVERNKGKISVLKLYCTRQLSTMLSDSNFDKIELEGFSDALGNFPEKYTDQARTLFEWLARDIKCFKESPEITQSPNPLVNAPCDEDLRDEDLFAHYLKGYLGANPEVRVEDLCYNYQDSGVGGAVASASLLADLVASEDPFYNL